MSYDSIYSRGFARCLNKFGTSARIRYFSATLGSVYDDDVSLVKSGNDLWISGVVESLNLTRGSADSNFVEQGKLVTEDSKFYVNGSLVFTGISGNQFKIQIGSPTGQEYSLIPEGGIDHQVNGVLIFKAGYLRRLTTGSIFGEA